MLYDKLIAAERRGAREKNIENARKALALNVQVETVAAFTGLSLEEVKALASGA